MIPKSARLESEPSSEQVHIYVKQVLSNPAPRPQNLTPKTRLQDDGAVPDDQFANDSRRAVLRDHVHRLVVHFLGAHREKPFHRRHYRKLRGTHTCAGGLNALWIFFLAGIVYSQREFKEKNDFRLSMAAPTECAVFWIECSALPRTTRSARNSFQK